MFWGWVQNLCEKNKQEKTLVKQWFVFKHRKVKKMKKKWKKQN